MAHPYRARRGPQRPKPLQIEFRDPKRLKENPHNARTHSQKQLSQIQASISRFGFTNPILADEIDQIIAGHGRQAAAIALGLAKVPVITITGLDETERSALALADNKLALNAGWNIEILKNELTFLTDIKADFDVSITGFDMVEIDNLLSPMAEGAPDPNEDAAPAPSKIAVSHLGDRWMLGPHVVVCGDALEPSTYVDVLGKERARMAFLDAPYNVKIGGHVSGLGRKRHREFAMASGEMSQPVYTQFLVQAFTLTAKHCVDGAILFECIDWRHMSEVLAAGVAARLELKNLIVWDKTNAGMGTFYRSEHELIFPFKVGSKPHINNFGLGDRGRYRTNVWKYPGCNTFRPGRATELDAHPTPKPVALVADAIRDVSNRGDIVLDCFGGSGTTLIAAEKTGRRARLIELDPIYVDVINRRWETLTGQEAVHSSSKQTFAQLSDKRSQ